MKNTILTLLCFAAVFSANAQTKKDIFNAATPVTWIGLDFTEAKFIGDRERLGSHSDVLHLMEALNQLVINEPAKYDIGKAIGRANIEKSIGVTSENNAQLEVNEMLSDQSKDYLRLKSSDIQNIIASYDFKGLSGIGLMFNIEAFSKMDESASIWVTFVNMDSKEVLFTERLTAKPGGFGLRNFWGRAIYGVIEKIKRSEFQNWKKRNS
jgi:hypothetical protein